MRGYVEESDEVKRLRELKDAARKYAGQMLISFDYELEESRLKAAAVAYAATQPRPRKRTNAARNK
jgi:hypothetical protein